ncbi:MAG: S41 family peptidase [Rikenellaceae bacterium]
MKKIILTSLLSMAAVVGFSNPLWLRYSSISPDGSTIAFKYKGDIYTVSTNGGQATQLTSTSEHETTPIWSNDSKTLAFASDKDGGFDIYTIDVKGGPATKITSHSVAETPLAFSPDDKYVYYSATIQDPASSALNPAAWITELYKVDAKGGRPEMVVAAPISNISFDSDGESFLYYNRSGSENIWRKHHTSSVARDIFRYDAKTKKHAPIIERAGEDRDPIYTADKKGFYFLSERDSGSFNIYKTSLDNTDKVEALTKFKDHPVRFLSRANDGTLAFSYHGQLYTMKEGSSAKKLNIEILNDQPVVDVDHIRLSSANEFSFSEDGKEIALISRGEVFATTDKYATTKQISKTPEAERGISMSPDGKTIIYASERTGTWNIYKATKVRDEEVNFANSTLINEEPLFKDNTIERFAPQFSPDGKEVAFIENRNLLKVLNLESGKIRAITDGSKHITNDDYAYDFNYSWSPDGKWFTLTFITNRRDPYSDIGIVSAVDGGKIYNITNSAYIDTAPKWVLDGNAIIYASNRLGLRAHASWGSQDDIFIAFLNQESYDKFKMSKEELELFETAEKNRKDKEAKETEDKKDDKDKEASEEKDEEETKEIEIDLDRLEDRIVRLTPMSSNLMDYALSKDGETLYFLSRFESRYDLWEVSPRSGDVKILKKTNAGGSGLQLSKDGKSLYMFGSSTMKIDLPSGSSTPITFSMEMDLDRAGEREYMFNHVFRQQEKRFYNTNYHGVDLTKLKKAYQPFLSHINNNYDFSEMLSEILGELNVSHTGSGYFAPSSGKVTPEFGILFDTDYKGDGLKVDHVLKYGPFDNSTTKIENGVLIEKIDGIEILADKDYFETINGKAGKNVLLSLYNPSNGQRWEEVFKPISRAAQNTLLYKRWIETRAAEVDRLSNGRLGYVHITSMSDASYRDVYSDILGRYNNREGIVIDTRNNGGGRLHEDIEILFSGEKYLEQVIRGEITCDMPSRRYNKPSIMIVCEANYSNAHGTPWVYRNRGIGSIVGMPVPGTMTSVNWETLQDSSMYFGIPVIGYRTQDGEYLENSQLEPDFKVRNEYDKIISGEDQQLETAVEELLKQIDAAPAQW